MDAVNEDGHAYLLDLPTELVQGISEYHPVGEGSLLQLRLTCRDVCAKIERLVGHRYFSDRAFPIADKAILDTLLQISRPKVFAKSMD